MDFFTGQIMQMATAYAPRQTALCSGQMLPVNQNAALFSLLGISFGGDGQPGGNFALPNLQGRTAQGFGNAGSVMALGTAGGEAEHVLQYAEMPQHLHTIAVSEKGTVGANPSGALPGVATQPVYGPLPQSPASPTPLAGAPLANVGSGLAHTNMQPSLAINHVIVLYGVYPSRS